MNTNSPTVRRLVAPLLVVGLLAGSMTTHVLAAQACTVEGCQAACCRSESRGAEALARRCCQTVYAVAQCDMACCQAPLPLLPRSPADTDIRTERVPTGGKLGWVGASLDLESVHSLRLSSTHCTAASMGGDNSLIAQHVRLQI